MPVQKKKAKIKTKSKAKVKTRSKAVKKVKAKKKIKSPVRAKRKVKVKVKARAKVKTKVKAKVKAKTKVKQKSPVKKIARKKPKKYSDAQKNELLTWIEKIVNIHKGQEGGLKSFAGIDQILNKYNQHYTNPSEKFDAIARFGLDKDPRVIHEHFFVNVEGREEDVNELFILLAQIAKAKMKYADAKEKIQAIYMKSLAIHKLTTFFNKLGHDK